MRIFVLRKITPNEIGSWKWTAGNSKDELDKDWLERKNGSTRFNSSAQAVDGTSFRTLLPKTGGDLRMWTDHVAYWVSEKSAYSKADRRSRWMDERTSEITASAILRRSKSELVLSLYSWHII
jgi:hypothetical protein